MKLNLRSLVSVALFSSATGQIDPATCHEYLAYGGSGPWEYLKAEWEASAYYDCGGGVMVQGHLVSIESKEENEFLASILIQFPPSSYPLWWTSGNDLATEGAFEWDYGSGQTSPFWEGYSANDQPINDSYGNWGANQPAGPTENHNCVAIRFDTDSYLEDPSSAVQWVVVDCSRSLHYVGEYDCPCPSSDDTSDSTSSGDSSGRELRGSKHY